MTLSQLRSTRARIRTIGLFSTLLATHICSAQQPDRPDADPPPNVVIIFIDDLGYADIGPFGATAYKTPHLDRMAREGRVFTDFHSATAVCSASRVALLTGCYPERVSILGALNPQCAARHQCRRNDARRALSQPRLRHRHLRQMASWAITANFCRCSMGSTSTSACRTRTTCGRTIRIWRSSLAAAAERKRRFPPLPLFRNNEIVDSDVDARDQAQLTTQYTEHAVDFIERNKSQPFFLYVPHTMVHVPIFASEKFLGKSGAGLFGDVVTEIDWSVGQILEALRRNDLDDNTLVIFTSDNGPWLSYGNHGGSAGPLREGKGTMFEGGYRVPCVMRWPGKIPAGTRCDELAATMDLFPTIARLIGATVPDDRVIDGKDIWPLMAGEPEATSPHEVFYCYYDRELRAVRDRRWKLVFPHRIEHARRPARRKRRHAGSLRPARSRPLAVRSEERSRRNDRCRGRASGDRRSTGTARRKGPRGSGRHADRPRRKRSAARRSS